MEFTVVQGDVAEQSADALVNAAGTSLRMGSGVAGARLVCETVWAHEPRTLTDVRVIAYGESQYRTLQAVAERVRSS